jgi:1-deoxyxylulose-5-phosphate synthase
MLPLCAAQGVGTMIWSPFARGRLARPWQAAATTRSSSDAFAGLLYTSRTAGSDHAIIDAVGEVAAARGVSRAQVALAWLRPHPRRRRAASGRELGRADRRRRGIARHRADR